MIDGKVVVQKMGATVLRHLQVNQYLRYWKPEQEPGLGPTRLALTDTPQHTGGHRKRTQIRCSVRLTRR